MSIILNIINFWFIETSPEDKFNRSDDFDKKIKDPRSFSEGKEMVRIIRSFLKINCKLQT